MTQVIKKTEAIEEIEQSVLSIVGKSIVLAKLSLDIPFRLRLKLKAQPVESTKKVLNS